MLKQQARSASQWQHTLPETGGTARLDREAAHEVLEAAAQLQRAEQETLSEAEVTRIAAEMGIEARHVHRALARSRQRQSSQRRWAIVTSATVLAPFLYGLLVTVVVWATYFDSRLASGPLIAVLSSVVAPTLLTICLGWRQRTCRAGAAVGTWIFLCLVSGTWLGDLVRNGLIPSFYRRDIVPLLLVLLCAVLLGVGAAALRKFMARRRPQKPTTTPVPETVSPSTQGR